MQLAQPLGVTLDYLCGMYGMYEEEERVLARPYSIRRLLIYGGHGKGIMSSLRWEAKIIDNISQEVNPLDSSRWKLYPSLQSGEYC